MKRDSLSDKFARSNIRTKLFNECSFCHDFGLKQGVLETSHGDYGIRQYLEGSKELLLNSNGLCDECEKLLNEKSTK